MALDYAYSKLFHDFPEHKKYLENSYNKNNFFNLPSKQIDTFSKFTHLAPEHVGIDTVPDETNSLNHLFRKHNQYSTASFDEYKKNVFPYMERNSKNFKNTPFKRTLAGEYTREIKKLKH